MRNRDRKRSRTLGGSRADNGEARGGFHLQSFSLDPDVGERGSAHQGVGNKPDTFKSLHMVNLSGRGAAILFGDCLLSVGLNQFG